MQLTLLGEPRSTNHIYKHRVIGKFASVYMSNEGKDLKESYQWQAKSQYREKPLEVPLIVEVQLYFCTKRNHDIDNYSKLLLDALTGVAWVDDGQIQRMTVEKLYDKENPRIELQIIS